MYATARRLAALQEDADFPVEVNRPLAVQLLHRCIDEHSHIGAMYDLATILSAQHWDIEHNLPLAVDLYSRCAVDGHVPAMYHLAQILSGYSPRVRMDAPRAVQLYQRCIDACAHLDAMKCLADILADGAPGVRMDRPRALPLYRRCVDERNDTDAMMRLAWLYVSGKWGVQSDVSRAVQLCDRCIQTCADTHAVLDFAKHIIAGECDMEQDVQLGMRLLKLCSDKQDLPAANIALAEVYLSAVPDDDHIQRAMVLFERSLQYGVVVRQARQLADTIANGSSIVKPNVRLAVRMYGLLVDKCNDRQSIRPLAETLVSQDAAVVDKNRVIELCKAQIKFGPCANVLRLARKLASGTPRIPRNAPLAIHLCELCIAEKPNNVYAVCTLARALLSGTPSLHNVNRAIKLCKRICDMQPEELDAFTVRSLAEDLACGTPEVARNLPLAIQLGEMLVNKSNNEGVLATYAKILLIDTPGPETIPRVLDLCEKATKENWHCLSMVQLARDIWSGTPEIERNIPLAMQLCEVCMNQRDSNGELTLAEFLLTGPANIRDIRRGVQLCQDYLDRTDCVAYFNDVMGDIARVVAKGTPDTAANKALAEELCAMSIDKGNRPLTMVTLAEILLSGMTEAGAESGRVMELCETSLIRSSHRVGYASDVNDDVVGLAVKLRDGTGGIARDVKLAIRLLELCVEKRNSKNALECLAGIFAVGAPGVPRFFACDSISKTC